MRCRKPRRSALVLPVAIAVATAIVLPGGALADSSGHAQPQTPNPGQFSNALNAVGGASSSDVWAVGFYGDQSVGALQTLILHWNGSAWTQVPSANASSHDNVLNGVRAINAHNVWAVGRYQPSFGGPYLTLTEHWDGKTWTVVPSPSPSATNNGLQGVNGGGSGNRLWAVGYYKHDATGALRTLAMQRTGGAWVVETTPSPDGTENVLYGDRVPSSTDAWGVGHAGAESLIVHWDGSRWRRVTSPNPSPTTNGLFSTSGVSPSNGWAVGWYDDNGVARTLTEHWNGSKWSVVKSPNPGATFNQLSGVRAVAANDAWAVGRYIGEDIHTQNAFIIQWNGSKWAPAFAPNPGAVNQLNGVTALSANDAWAVGYYDNGAGVLKTLALHWNGTTWVQK